MDPKTNNIMGWRHWRKTLAMAFLAATVPALAQLPKAGGEVLVNANSINSEKLPAVCMDAAGNFVVAYMDTDSADAGVQMRRYDRKGVALGSYFRPYTAETLIQSEPSVAMANDGRFVVVWEDNAARNGNSYDVLFSLYNAAGTKVAGPARVNTIASGVRENPRVSMNRTTGEFVVTWAGGSNQANVDVFMRRYNAAGTALDAADVKVNTSTNLQNSGPSVAMAGNGKFIIGWEGNQDGDFNYEAMFQRYTFNAGGAATPNGTNTIASASGHDTTNVSVACDETGNFVLIWVDGLPSTQTDPKDLLFRRYDANGAAVTPITIYKAGAFAGNGDSLTPFARVAMQSNSNFVVTYLHDDEIYARFFTAAGALQGSEIHVNTTTSPIQGEYQSRPGVDINPAGTRAVIAWQGTGALDSNGIHLQRFAAANNAPVLNPIGNKTVEELQTLQFTASANPNDVGESIVYSLTGTIPAGASINSATGAFTWTPTAAQAPGSYQVTVRATDDGEPPAYDDETITITVTKIPDTTPPVSKASIADKTIAGTATIPVTFVASDAGSGVASTRLFVRKPGAGAFADSGLTALTGTAGTFNYTAGADGIYEFYTISTDNQANVEAAPATADAYAVINLVANSALELAVTATTQTLVFPMTMALDTTITLSGAQAGTSLTVSRTVNGPPPAYFNSPAYLLKESLSIQYTGPSGFTAQLLWGYDPANLVAPADITEAFRFDGGPTPAGRLPATKNNGVITVNGITGFSTWYAGTSPAGIDTWSLY